MNSCELANFRDAVRNGRPVGRSGNKVRIDNVMLLGRVRGRVEEPLRWAQRASLEKGATLWVLDVFGVKDIDGLLGVQGAGHTYIASGTIMFSYLDTPGIEGSLVYVRGARYSNKGKYEFRKLNLQCDTMKNSWMAVNWNKTDEGWVIGPCYVGPLRRRQISNDSMLHIALGVAETGELEYPENAYMYGTLSWNGNDFSDDEGVAIPSRNSVLWRQQNDEGYSFIENEGKAYWGEDSVARDLSDEANPENKLGVRVSDAEKSEFDIDRITGEAATGVENSNAFRWNADRHGEEGPGFGVPQVDIEKEVRGALDKWSGSLSEMFATAKETVDERFLKAVGRVWYDRVLAGNRYSGLGSRKVFEDASNRGYVRKMLNTWVISEIMKIEEAVKSNFGAVPVKELHARNLLFEQEDYLTGDISYVMLGSIVVILSTGIRVDGNPGFSWYANSSALLRRLCSSSGKKDPMDQVVAAAKCIVCYGEEAVRRAGLPEYYLVGRSRCVRSYGLADVWKRVFEAYKSGGGDMVSPYDVTDGLFTPRSAVTALDMLECIEVDSDIVYSSAEWVKAQCEEVGCFLEISEEGKTRYYSIIDAARSLTLWSRLRELEVRGNNRGREGRETWEVSKESVDYAIQLMEEEKGFALDPTQKEAVRTLASGGLGVLTGVAGSGKSTVLKCLIYAVEKEYPGIDVRLAAPTGKAAKRMTETTGRKAYTMHSMFRVMGGSTNNIRWVRDFAGSKRYEACDSAPAGLEESAGRVFYIFDEVSMCGFGLLCRVIAALGGSCDKVLFVGDKEQLPPVLDAPVFAEVLSVAKKAFRLGESHRAAEGSLPTKNAYKVLRGEGATFQEGETFRIDRAGNGEIQERVLKEFIAGVKKYGIDGCRVVTPYKKAASVEKWGYASSIISGLLGDMLKETGVVEDVPGAPHGEVVLSWRSSCAQEFARIGDRVLNVENTRNVPLMNCKGEIVDTADIVNGQEGIIMAIIKGSPSRGNASKYSDKYYTLLVDMSDDATGVLDEENGKYCAFEVKSTRWPGAGGRPEGVPENAMYVTGLTVGNLEVSYAETVHKMQGSEVPCIIIPASTECRNSSFFNRALVYTAITRASKEVVIVGDAGDYGTSFARASKRGAVEDPRETVFGFLGLYNDGWSAGDGGEGR